MSQSKAMSYTPQKKETFACKCARKKKTPMTLSHKCRLNIKKSFDSRWVGAQAMERRNFHNYRSVNDEIIETIMTSSTDLVVVLSSPRGLCKTPQKIFFFGRKEHKLNNRFKQFLFYFIVRVDEV
jgi:hypothetical protein